MFFIFQKAVKIITFVICTKKTTSIIPKKLFVKLQYEKDNYFGFQPSITIYMY